jgi:tetratricopeptide (TPR) repeat protein
MAEFMSKVQTNWWESWAGAVRLRTMHELGNLRVALDWTLTSEQDRTLAYELLGRCWPLWIPNGLIGEGIERMQRLWPPPSTLPAKIDAEFCLGFANLNKFCGREEHLEAARRAAILYRQDDDADRLSLALLLVTKLSAAGGRMSEAGEALREAEKLLCDTGPLRKQIWLAEMQGHYYRRLGEHERAIAAFRHRQELFRRGGIQIGEYHAIGDLGCAQLDAGDLDAAIESLRTSIEGLNRLKAPFGLERQPCMLALALAGRGDEIDVLPLAREAFYDLQLRAPFAPLMAAALQHARRNEAQRAVLLAGYAYSKLCWQEPPRTIALAMQRRVVDRAAVEHPAAMVEAWLRAGERLTEEQAAAIAFDDAPLDAPQADSTPAPR